MRRLKWNLKLKERENEPESDNRGRKLIVPKRRYQRWWKWNRYSFGDTVTVAGVLITVDLNYFIF